MIEKIYIKNFKSIEELTLSLGRINVFIGENGCGKSNILEAICMASAANSDRLDNEFLASRGIRISSPKFTRSAFDSGNVESPILFQIKTMNCDDETISIKNDNEEYSKWFSEKNTETDWQKNLKEIITKILLKERIESNKVIRKKELRLMQEELEKLTNSKLNILFNNFLIYSPENTSLRKFDKEGKIEPLGVNGEGLFKLLKVLSQKNKLSEIKTNLQCMGWFEDFLIENTGEMGRKIIQIKDRYIDKEFGYFTHHSANEGFLFILFYICLFISEDTPKFFAVDNIDASLNPKLCSDLTEILVRMAKKYGKQAIFTTHNASVLDGLDLNDDEQRLFVVSRNRKGRTKIKRIHKPKLEAGQDPVKLSTIFTRGYIGGLSRGF